MLITIRNGKAELRSDNDSVVRFSSATTPARAGVSSVSDSAYWLLNRFSIARYVD